MSVCASGAHGGDREMGCSISTPVFLLRPLSRPRPAASSLILVAFAFALSLSFFFFFFSFLRPFFFTQDGLDLLLLLLNRRHFFLLSKLTPSFSLSLSFACIRCAAPVAPSANISFSTVRLTRRSREPRVPQTRTASAAPPSTQLLQREPETKDIHRHGRPQVPPEQREGQAAATEHRWCRRCWR